jgi:3-oxoacyl-[acyl-carrier-protein] synthase-3
LCHLLSKMNGTERKLGIVSYGLYAPAGFETVEEIAAKSGLSLEEVKALGIDRKHRPGDEDQPILMAVRAAEQAFEQAEGVNPRDVDVVIWTGEEYKDYIAQTASIRLQEEVGCKDAWAFDLVGQGVTSIVGLRVAQDLMIGDKTIETVLLAGGTRNIDRVDYANPDTRFLLATSASGGAIILRRDHDKNHLLSTGFIVDSEMADEVFVPGGGTERPYSPENLGTAMMYFQAAHSAVLADYMARRWPQALAQVVKKVLPGRSIDYLALRHLSLGDRDRVLAELNLKTEQSASLSQFGHHGPNDVIISLQLGINTGAIKPSSVVVLASGGIGFAYAAAAVLWGPC